MPAEPPDVDSSICMVIETEGGLIGAGRGLDERNVDDGLEKKIEGGSKHHGWKRSKVRSG